MNTPEPLGHRRKNLVIVRAGETSLHPQWLTRSERHWDLALSYYGSHPERYMGQYDLLHHYRGSKWEGISDFLAQHPEIVDRYEYIWLPDDDLFTTADNINGFFDRMGALNFVIGQPALTRYSHYSWDITRQRPDYLARVTNFVEIMAPCFRADLLHHFQGTFTENSSGWGLEWLWQHRLKHLGLGRMGIIDKTPVFHTRAVGAAGHGGSRQSPRQEQDALLQRHGISADEPRVIDVIHERNAFRTLTARLRRTLSR